MKKLLINLATHNIQNEAKPFLDNHQQYAERNNYTYRSLTFPHWVEIHPSFSRLWEIKRGMEEGFDIILWADADILFTNFRVDLASLVSDDGDTGWHVATYNEQAHHQQPDPIMLASTMVWRTCQKGRESINELVNTAEALVSWVCRPWDNPLVDYSLLGHPWEQRLINTYFYNQQWWGVHLCGPEEIGSIAYEVWNGGIHNWEPGMPTIHFGGISWEYRRELAIRYQDKIVS